ncbi:single-strand DNA-binding protein [Hyphomicrobium sp. 1Nfss2.1]|uniref:single-stranded DNA-binding protein n=1 Tax=Hyphomicrobium sp. 1Nfss2.1 TaxID=3413936 RepID=UPI003C7BC16F
MNGIEAAFTGRVGTEPEKRTSQAGKPWLRFNVAAGQDEATQWVQVACFGSAAEELSDRLGKGDRVYVEGTIKLNIWTDREGKERSGLSVAAWKCERLGNIGRSKLPPRRDKPSSSVSDVAKRNSQRPLDDDLIRF